MMIQMMQSIQTIKEIKQNEKGFLALDFIFALIVSFSVIILFFGLTLTLTAVEIGQYIVFATSRNYSAAHLNRGMQEQEARAKYQRLLSSPQIPAPPIWAFCIVEAGLNFLRNLR